MVFFPKTAPINNPIPLKKIHELLISTPIPCAKMNPIISPIIQNDIA